MHTLRPGILILLAAFLVGCGSSGPSGALVVRVFDLDTGEPVRGASVSSVNLLYYDLNPFRPGPQYARTNESGEAVFSAKFYNEKPPDITVVHADYFPSTNGSTFSPRRDVPRVSDEQHQQRTEQMRLAWESSEPFLMEIPLVPVRERKVKVWSDTPVDGFIEVDFMRTADPPGPLPQLQDGVFGCVQNDSVLASSVPVVLEINFCGERVSEPPISGAPTLDERPEQRLVRPVSDTGPIDIDLMRYNDPWRRKRFRTRVYFVGTLAEYQEAIRDNP
ncbi:MAG: hypothetical protein H6813_06145 [Phycisphaeraceae bacterium]|nr:hypothetical protein [Phycisphaeraceae bacterium]MCB9848051.1 hypothetical protein [Phycisphaeraceae bacterium]